MAIRNLHHRLNRTHDGEIHPDQGIINKFFLSFNPDDNRFYVCNDENGTNVRSTFKRFDNAVR